VGTGLVLQDNVLSIQYGDGATSAVASGDPRLTNARIPLPGSDDYVQNGTKPQPGSFALSGTGETGGRLTTKSDLLVNSTVDPSKPGPLLQVLATSDTPKWTGLPLLTVDAAGGILAQGEQGVGKVPATTKTVKLMWLPHVGAFRAGGAETQWTEGNIGAFSFATGTSTTASGKGSAAFGESCVASGIDSFAAGNSSIASGTGSVSFGDNCVASGVNAMCVGSANSAMGSSSLAVGTGATATGRNTVAIGSQVRAVGDFSIAMGQSVSTDGFLGAFIWGDGSLVPTPTTATANNQFTVRALGGIRLKTNAAMTIGCEIKPNSGSMDCTSDRDVKEDFRPVDREAVLEKVARLPIETWRYKGATSDGRHLGPVAQDFHAAFGLGSSDKSIGMLDINGVNMAAIQALELRTRELAAKTAEVDALKAEMAELRRGLSRLREAMEAKAQRP